MSNITTVHTNFHISHSNRCALFMYTNSTCPKKFILHLWIKGSHDDDDDDDDDDAAAAGGGGGGGGWWWWWCGSWCWRKKNTMHRIMRRPLSFWLACLSNAFSTRAARCILWTNVSSREGWKRQTKHGLLFKLCSPSGVYRCIHQQIYKWLLWLMPLFKSTQHSSTFWI